MIDKKKAKKDLEKKGYRIVEGNSAVKICTWTKNSLTNKGVCYKEQFYGIKSHLCCQISCSLFNCQNKCIHCWRDQEYTEQLDLKKIDDPKKIISGSIIHQRKLIEGFKGNSKINLKKFKEAQNPNQFAISLTGEPTIYPKLGELVDELRRQGKTSFIVTNGLVPEKLIQMQKENQLPTQLYLSLNAPNKTLYEKWHRNPDPNAWKKFNKTISIFPKLKTRKVIRMTLVRGINLKPELISQYAKLIKKINPDFIEIKSYMSVGAARKRKNMGYDAMVDYDEILEYSKEITKKLNQEGYKILDTHIPSRVVLIGKEKKKMKIKKAEY